MENILLDIKMNQEQMPMHIMPQIPSNITFEQMIQESPSFTHEEMPSEEINENDYKSVIDNAHNNDLEPNNLTQLDENHSISNIVTEYDSMTKEELIEIAKKKGLRVGNRPGREKLLSLIRKSEEVNQDLTPFETVPESDA